MEVLFSPYNGLLYWHPFLLAALAGLLMAVVRKDRILGFAILGFILTLYINAAWHAWQFGASFGHRGFTGTLPFLAIGIAWLTGQCRTRRQLKALLGAAAVLAFFNIWLCVLYCTGTIDRNGPVLPADVLKGSFELGRLVIGFLK